MFFNSFHENVSENFEKFSDGQNSSYTRRVVMPNHITRHVIWWQPSLDNSYGFNTSDVCYSFMLWNSNHVCITKPAPSVGFFEVPGVRLKHSGFLKDCSQYSPLIYFSSFDQNLELVVIRDYLFWYARLGSFVLRFGLILALSRDCPWRRTEGNLLRVRLVPQKLQTW